MRYLRAYQYVFAHAGWGMNWLAASACQVVPVLGQIVFTGYAFEVLESLREEDDCSYPLFDVNRMGAYLQRGLWPTIVQMLVVLPVIFAAWILGFVLAALMAGDVRGGSGPRLLLALLVPIAFGIFILLGTVLVPLTLHVGFRQELTQEAAPYVQDFLRRVWRETMLAQVFVAVTGAALTAIGSLLCCFPALAALALWHFAWYHLLAQLHELYLQRGGTPVGPPAAETSPPEEPA